jgi:hypothetical protein
MSEDGVCYLCGKTGKAFVYREMASTKRLVHAECWKQLIERAVNGGTSAENSA